MKTIAHEITCMTTAKVTRIFCKSPIGICGIHSVPNCKKCHMAFTEVSDAPDGIIRVARAEAPKKEKRSIWSLFK